MLTLEKNEDEVKRSLEVNYVHIYSYNIKS